MALGGPACAVHVCALPWFTSFWLQAKKRKERAEGSTAKEGEHTDAEAAAKRPKTEKSAKGNQNLHMSSALSPLLCPCMWRLTGQGKAPTQRPRRLASPVQQEQQAR